MNRINPLRHGAAFAFLAASLLGCASKPVQTRTEFVDRPVSVAVPAVLTTPVEDAPVPDPLTNDGLAGVAEGEKCRKTLANCQLERIEALQPGGPRREAKWCLRYETACKVSP